MARQRDPALAAAIRALVSDRGYLEVHVTPNARSTALQLPAVGDPPVLAVRLAVAPEGGKANREVIRLVAEALGVARSDITLAQGTTARRKRLRLPDLPDPA